MNEAMRDFPLLYPDSYQPPVLGSGPGLARRDHGASWTAARVPLAESERSLNLAAQMWINSLPEGYPPQETAALYPRILNRIARNWDSAPMLDAIFDDLLYAKRRGRKGFPAGVQREIRNLYVLHQSRNAKSVGKGDIWSGERMPAARETRGPWR